MFERGDDQTTKTWSWRVGALTRGQDGGIMAVRWCPVRVRVRETTLPNQRTKPKPEADHGHAGLRRGHEMEDSAQTANWGVRMRSAYLSIVGDSPRLKPDDRRNASRHLARIQTAIEKGGWTRGEWRRLYAMRRKWGARAAGTDERFRLFGTLQGGLTRHQQSEVDLHRTINRVKNDLGGTQG